MFEFIGTFSAFMVFISIGGFGLTVMVISSIFGGDHELSHEVELGHEFDVDHEYGGPGFFSARILSTLVTIFGFTGAIAIVEGAAMWLAILIAFASGITVSFGVLAVARFLYSGQASSQISDREIIGQAGTVVVTIPPNGIGRIRLAIGGVSIEKLARSDSAKPLDQNTTIRVKGIIGNFVVVE